MRRPDEAVADRRMEDLSAEARYWRERSDLYRAKSYGPRPTTPGRLRELERAARDAETRLKRAQEASGDVGHD